MLQPTANEIPQLIRRLGSRSRARVDAARARLTILGARAVEYLVESLDGDDNRIRARVMPLLALIQDPRGHRPLMLMLGDRSPRLRETAARALSRFPSSETVAALIGLLQRESHRRVRVACVRSLVDLAATGQEDAVGPLLELLADRAERQEVRIAAMSLLELFKPAQRKGLLARLVEDPSRDVRRRATALEAELAGDRAPSGPDVPRLLADLARRDYEAWNEALRRLSAGGAVVIRPLIAEMQSRAHDPEYCTRAGLVLKGLGPRQVRALVDLLDEIDEPLPLQVVVETVGAVGEKSSIYRLKDLIDRLGRRPQRPPGADGFDPLRRVRAKAHLELARVGSRVAVLDLRDAIADRDCRLEIELLAAVELIGKREELPVLLAAWQREDRFMRRRLAEVVRSIMKRERIRRNDRVFRALSAESRRALEAILPPVARRRRRAPAARRSDRPARS